MLHLTICMENPLIPVRNPDKNSRERFNVRGENSSEKRYYLPRYYLFTAFTETSENVCTICVDYIRLPLKRKQKIVNGTFLFLEKSSRLI